MSSIQLRRARMDELGALSDLALRSKAHWGYDQGFLEACRSELTVTPAQLKAEHVVVAERDGELLGFYALAADPPEGELTNLWVDRPHIGAGVGRALFDHAAALASSLGVQRIRIDADPGAEPFYRRMGAIRIGLSQSGSIRGRSLPLMELLLTQR
ncbi:MAG: GNAT family N-acetyltransferase [Chloroflexi bacterium]|nr:MAG: GNAT family N-acetyltransferase [Chloroflexota bacterium]